MPMLSTDDYGADSFIIKVLSHWLDDDFMRFWNGYVYAATPEDEEAAETARDCTRFITAVGVNTKDDEFYVEIDHDAMGDDEQDVRNQLKNLLYVHDVSWEEV